MEFDTTIDWSKLAYGDHSETLKFSLMLAAAQEADRLTKEPLDSEEGAE